MKLSDDDPLREFARGYPFELDSFQVEACRALLRGRGALVAAPTGSGKTVVGEFAVWLALQRGLKTFYTTPLKALSNQKYGDFVARHHARRVGLLTGDNSINGEAPIVVMTTEVLRNMLYESSPTLANLGFVVMDEVHYLQDRYRGGVWEEVMVHLAQDVRVVSLSATVSNVEEFGAWLTSVRGPTCTVVEERRPVPLRHSYLVGHTIYPTFSNDAGALVVNPVLERLTREQASRTGPERRERVGRRGRTSVYIPSRVEVLDILEKEGLLPAIVFVFSRAGCNQAVEQALAAGVQLTTDEEAERIREYAELRTSVLPAGDLDTLDYGRWVESLARGVGAHHAGMIPVFKETVEELFARGLVKGVFATETLSLGINMPAKAVVIERLMKWQGERHEFLTPGEYTQLTGRAGRRGIDERGSAIVLYQPLIPATRVAELASACSYPLHSSFRPSYNMAVNLARRHSPSEAARLLSRSFAQFEADRSVVEIEAVVSRNRLAVARYREAAACDAGDFEQYWALRREINQRQRSAAGERRRSQRSETARVMSELRVGDVVRLPGGRRGGLAVVVETRRDGRGAPLLTMVTQDRRARRVSGGDLVEAPILVSRLAVAINASARSAKLRRELGLELARLRAQEAPDVSRPSPAQDPDIPRLRAEHRAHSCHGCPERAEHERWAERADRLERDTDALVRHARKRTETLARMYERVMEVLRSMGYLAGDRPTAKGEILCRVYCEADLLVVEALDAGVWAGLTPPELAACVSALVYEARGPTSAPGGAAGPKYPTAKVKAAHLALLARAERARLDEESQGVQLLKMPDPGFLVPAYVWARGDPLDEVLAETDSSAGDFVRAVKQTLDLLQQVGVVSPDPVLADTARSAWKAMQRGVVACSGAL